MSISCIIAQSLCVTVVGRFEKVFLYISMFQFFMENHLGHTPFAYIIDCQLLLKVRVESMILKVGLIIDACDLIIILEKKLLTRFDSLGKD